MRLLPLLVGGLLLARVGYSAANVVPATRTDDVQVRSYVGNEAQKARDMAPPQCSPIRSSLVRIVYIGGSPGTPGNQSELVLGRPAFDLIDALGGHDCVLGGGSNYALRGRAGNDVCYGETDQGGAQRVPADAPARRARPPTLPQPSACAG